MRPFISTAILFLTLIFSNTLLAKVYYVNASYTGSTANGNSWTTPFKKLENAIAATADGDEIWVAKGTYVSLEALTTPGLSGYFIDKNIALYGGFAGTESNIYARNIELNKTILKGFSYPNGGNGSIFNLKLNKLLILDGFDITSFGYAVSAYYDIGTSSSNWVVGDRYKLTINNCNFYDASIPFSFANSIDLTVSNTSFKNLFPSYVGNEGSTPAEDPLTYSVIKFTNSKFDYTNANAGVMSFNNGKFDIANCQFNIGSSASMIYFNGCRGWTLKGSSINGLRNSLFSGSTVSGEQIIEDCVFENFSGSSLFYSNGSGLPTDASLKISNTIFKNSTNAYEIYTGNTGLELDHVTFSNILFGNSNVINAYQGNVKITHSTFENLSASNNDCILMNYTMGTIEMDNITYKNNSIPFLNRSQNTHDTTKTSITNSVFQNNTIRPNAVNPSLISARGKITIANSTISDNTYLLQSSRPNIGLITINAGSSLILNDSKFERNTTNYHSGVVYAMYSDVMIDKCDFNNNDNSTFSISNYFSSAGALYLASQGNVISISKSNFNKNKSIGNGAAYLNCPMLEVSQCLFNENESLSLNDYEASALNFQLYYNSASPTGIINTCRFINNISITGTTIYAAQPSNSKGFTTINQCTIENNISSNGPSALVAKGGVLNVYNTLFSNNISSKADAGIFKRDIYTEQVNFYNCTFVKNKATGSGLFTGLYPNVIANSIFWGNGNEAPISLKSYPILINVSNSLVEGGFASGTKIFDTNPKFVDFAAGNYRLSCQSPLINKGDNTIGVSLFDLDGTPRIFSDTVDIGAYETHIDPALANVIPAPSFTIPASVCKEELIHTTNTTANIDNYNYQWVFGNEQKSTRVNPAYSYKQAGSYTVQLTASNFCGQTNSTSKQIIVKDNNAPTINTVSVICPGAEETYTTNAVCQKIVWEVTGGIIQSGQGTKSIKVLWGNGSTGNGKIELLATGCGVSACEVPVSVEVPIVPVNFTLKGANKVCQGAFAHYETVRKDKSASTLYNWSVKGGIISSNSSKDYNLTDIDVVWSTTATEGVVYLTTYNELLKCGKSDSFKVSLRPKYSITGNTEVCANTSVTYQVTPSVGAFQWQVTGTGNSISGTNNGYATWGSTEGTYKITAVPQDLSLVCNAQDTFLIHVNAKPIVTGITGETEVATNSVDIYTGQVNTNTADVDFNWVTPGATVVSSYLNTVTVNRDNFTPGTIALSVSTKKGACASAPYSIQVKKLFDYTITGPDTICIGSNTTTYNANVNPDQTATYAWTVGQEGTGFTGNSITPIFSTVGTQPILLQVSSNGKAFTVRKYVYVKASPSAISIDGPVVIEPTGLQTAVYTIKNPANSGFDIKITGGTKQSLVGNQLTVKWGGVAPFSIQAQDIFNSPACNGVPVILEVKKALELDKGISASGPACLNARISYSFRTDEHTKNLVWSLGSGGGVINTSPNSVTVEWNQTGSHTLTLKYDRFGAQTIQLPVVVNSLPSPVINQGTICGSNNFNLSTTQIYSAYSWYLNEATTPFSKVIFPSIMEEGLYTVSVTDNNGCINTASKYIRQVPLPKARVFTLDEVSVCTEQTNNQSNITLSTFEGQDYKYQWYENNSIIAGATGVSYVVQKPLNQEKYYSYTVKVSLEICEQTSAVENVIIRSCAPGAGNGNIGKNCSDLPVSFSVDQSSLCQPFKFIVDPSITSAADLGWDFGDGMTATGLQPSKSYLDAGVYRVQLTKGCKYHAVPVKVIARAIFKLDQPGCIGEELTFNELSINYPKNDITRWVWNFGDNTGDKVFSGTGDRNGKHTYNAAGNYKVTLTVFAKNDKGDECAFTKDTTYRINAQPIADFIVTEPSCVGNTYVFADQSFFGMIGKGSVKWTFGNGQTSVRDTTSQQFIPGNQTVQLKATNRLGCSATKSSTLTVSAPVQVGKISITSTDTLLCNGRTVTLFSPATATGKTYEWRKVGSAAVLATTQTYIVNTPGEYTVTYSPTSTCTATTAAIKVNSFTVPNLLSGEKLNCAGGVVNIKSNLTRADYTYAWKHKTDVLPNKTSELVLNNITTASAGDYQLTVTQSRTGCFVVLPVYNIEVNENPAKPDIHAAAKAICYNASAIVYTKTLKPGKTFNWYENTIKSATVDTVLTTSVLKNDAVYYVTVKDNATGCSAVSDNLVIKVSPAIPVVITGDTVLCEQVSSGLTSTLEGKDFTFQWYKNSQPTGGNFSKLNFTSIAKSDEGIYKLIVTSTGTTNLKGCTGVSNLKIIEVKPTAATPVITGVSEFCSGNSIVLSTNLSSDFVWNTGVTTAAITVTSGGIYSVKSTNISSGCTVTTSKTITQNPIPDLNFVPSGQYERCGTNKISFEGLNAYPIQKWYVNGKYFSDKKIIYPTESGKYTLEVTTNKGCTIVSDTMNINALECPCYVMNTNDSGDGSLREAINCSNDKPGKDAIKFDIKGTGPFTIKPLTPLPVITDAVVIDGFTQAGASPFRIIVDGTTQTLDYGFKVNDNLADVLIRGIKFTNFQKAIVLSTNVKNTLIENAEFTSNTKTAIEFNYGTQNNVVRNNSIYNGDAGIQFLTGSKNNTIQSNTINNATHGIELNGSSSNTLRANLISSSYKDGIVLKAQSTKNVLVSNEIRGSANNGILLAEKSDNNKIDSNYVGIDSRGNVSANVLNGIYISPNTRFNEISNNSISGNTQAGIVVEGNQTKVFKNLIGVDGSDVAKPNGLHGIYITGDSAAVFSNTTSTNGKYGINITGNSSYVHENRIRNNTSGGINVDGNKDRLSKNIITNTNAAVNAINLHLTVAPGNNGKGPATFTSYRRSAAGGIILKGTAVGNDTVEIFYNNNKPQQALLFAGLTVANAAGNWSIEIPEGPAFNPNSKNFYVNTATSTANNTSELSKPYLTGCFTCICFVTNVNDSGLGSFRAEIDSANAGACLTIHFNMTAPDTIKLLSSISPLKVPATIEHPSSSGADPMVFLKGTTSFNGLTLASDGAAVRGLGFTQFNQALILNSSFNTVEQVTIINSTRPLTIAGDSSTVLSSAINTTWANDLGTFKTDILVNITGKGNQIGGTNAGNKITNATHAGIQVNAKTGNTLLNNAIYNSTQAIRLINNGNNNYVAPTNMLGAINGNTATIQGVAMPNDKIQIFSSVYTGGQAFDFVVEATADALGKWTATIPANKVDLTKNNYFVATATSTTGNTSQLSGTIRVGNFTQVCYVTNTKDTGEGSLREAVNCANIAGVNPNGLPARIEFQLPATPNVITLTTELNITNNYGVSVNARAVPVTIKGATSTINCFKWATNNFSVKNLTFENFGNAMYCSGMNAVIDSNNFVNNTNAVYNNGATATTQLSITNNYFAGGTSGIKSDKGSLLIDKNTFGSTKDGSAGSIKGFGVSSVNAASAIVTNNTFASISKNADATSPATANGYVISVENASSVITNNTIKGEVSTQLPVIRLANNTQSIISSNTISTAYEGILLENCNTVTVSKNNLKSVLNKGFDLNKSVAVKITQNTVVGLQPNTKPISLNLATVNASNNSKQTPVILTSTYHDGKLFLIGQAEKSDEVELFYSNKKALDLVKYIEKSYADTTGTWIISFPISAEGSDTLFFRAVATKDVVQSSEASAAFTPQLKICPVTTKDDSGDGSLRQAIVDANADKCNLIQFKIPGSGVAEIRTTSLLPAITAKLLIVDGTSQSGYIKGSPTVDLIHTAAIAFDGRNGNQLDIYGMKITNFGTAIGSVNSKISNLEDNIIVDATNVGIKISTAAFTYGNIKNNSITTSGAATSGIVLDGTANMVIYKNTISGFGQAGISAKGNNQKITHNTLISSDSVSSIGIALTNSIGVFILSDTVRQAGTGIQITNGNRNQIASNIIGLKDKKAKTNKYNTNIGVVVNNSANCDVSLNVITVSTTGISLTGSNTFLIYSNTSNKVRDKGIYLKNSSNGTVSNNTIDSSSVGMLFDNAATNKVYNNLITRSLKYGIELDAGSDGNKFNANLIGARYVGDPTYAEGAGMLVKSSNNLIGNNPVAGLGNYIKQNKKGGIIVEGGTRNAITYNFFYNNDVTKGRPTAFAIALNNGGNMMKTKPSVTSHKWVSGKLHVSGTGNAAGDSIHLYLGTGGYEEVSRLLKAGKSTTAGNWTLIVDTAGFRLPKRLTWYVVATAMDMNYNTSPLSDMYILGDCYVTSLKDTIDNQYPLPNTLRMAMKCANGQANPVGVYFDVAAGGAKEVKLQMKLLTLDNHYGVRFDGMNIPDSIIAGMNGQKLASASWTIAATNAKSSIANFNITNAQDGLEVLADSILVKKIRFDKIINAGILLSNRYNVVDSCVFDTVAVGIIPSVAAFRSTLSGNTFNSTGTGVSSVGTDSLTISKNTFNKAVKTGIDIRNSTRALIASNTFINSTSSGKSITWNNTKGWIRQNRITAKFVANPVSVSNSTNFYIHGNTFADSADVYLALSDVSQGMIEGNTFMVANQNSIKTTNAQHLSIIGNYVQRTRNDAFNLVSSSTVFVSKNTVTAVRYTSKQDSALCINIHKGEGATQSNLGKEEPKNLKYEVKAGIDRRIGIFVNGLATAGDSIEVFFSDTISASMNRFVVKTFTQPNGVWEVKIPREFYYNDTTTWYHVIAVAIGADSNTSKTSAVLDIPPGVTKLYVLNEYDAGPNSLRQALLDVNNSDLYSQVIFSICLPKVKEGPYNIAIDSLFAPVFSYNGFKMDGFSQKENIGVGPDQRILVNGNRIKNNFGLDITEKSRSCLIKNMWMINTKMGLRLENEGNEIEQFNFINTDSSGVAKLDTAIHITKKSNENKLKNIFISDYTLGALITGAAKNEFTESIIDSTTHAVVLAEGASKSLIAKNTFTNIGVVSVHIDHAGDENKIDHNIFGKKGNPVIGNIIVVNSSNSQNIVYNRISYFDVNDTLPASTAFVIQGLSTGNYVYANRIGLDSLGKSVYKAKTNGIAIQSTADGAPVRNSIVGNEINGTNSGAIYANNSSEDLISENIIGGDSTRKVVGFDSTGIFISNCNNQQISDNVILGFSKHGIELLNSDNIQMHRNSLYSHRTKNKAININTSNQSTEAPVVTSGIVIDMNTMKVGGTAKANTQVEVFRSLKDTIHAVSYINKVTANAAGDWELFVPREQFTYSARNSFTAQTHDGTRSSELAKSFTPIPALCQLNDNPAIKVIEPLYKPCPGPKFVIDPDLDPTLRFAWKAPKMTDTLKSKVISILDTLMNLNLTVRDTMGCKLTRNTDVIFKAKPTEPDFIISSNVFARDTIVLVDISLPKPDSVKWFSSAGVTVLNSSTTSKDTLIGDDGLIYPKGVRFIQFILPEAGTYSIRQKSIKDGCFVEQTKTLNATPKDPNADKPYFVAPAIENMYVYPNPCIKGSDDVYINISVASKAEITLELYTEAGAAIREVKLSGSLKYDKKLFSAEGEHLFENNLSSGVYILKLTTGGGRKVSFKLIVQ